METAFTKNKSRIVPILERNLVTVVPKLYSVGLISEQDRDVALIPTVDSNTRAAALTRAVEGKVLHYHELLVFVYAVVSSTIDVAEKDFIKSLAYLPEHVTRTRHESLAGESTAESTTLPHRRRSSDPMIILKDSSELISYPPLIIDTMLQSNIATSALPSTSLGATNIPESETVIPQSYDQSESVKEFHKSEVDEFKLRLKDFSSLFTERRNRQQKFPGIKFSNNQTKQTVTHIGDIVKGEGIELQIPGSAIKRGDSVEFSIQACIDGPFELPEDVSLVTPVYAISPHYEFQKEVTVLMKSYSHLQTVEKDLLFLTSPAKREVDEHGSRWKFKINERKPGSDVRRIILKVKHFCLVCCGISGRVPPYEYRVSLHSPRTSNFNRRCDAVFSVSLYHEVFTQNLTRYLESHYGLKFCNVTCVAPVDITQDEIILRLNDDQTQGFTIVADKNKIMKSAVDNPAQSHWHELRAENDTETYPPRITLTITHTKMLQSPIQSPIHFSGISNYETFTLTIQIYGKRDAIEGFTPPPKRNRILDEHIGQIPLEEYFYSGSSIDRRLRMSCLLKLPLELETDMTHEINIPQEVGEKYNAFGKCLCVGDVDFEMEIYEKKNHEEINQDILQNWLDGRLLKCLPASWKLLSKALNRIGRNDLGEIVESNSNFLQLPLTMNMLLKFPNKIRLVNIPREVGAKYSDFGIYLLHPHDPTGAHISDLENQLSNNGEEINKRILMEWLEGEGRPVTWTTLVEALNIIEMGVLADKIEERYANKKI